MLDSYAHHPTELAADLRAAREIRPGGRVIAVFQPHLFSRTRIFAAALGAALGLADEAVVLDVYAAREDPEPGVTGLLVAAAVPGGRARFVPDRSGAPAAVAAAARAGDLVLTMGAGDVTAIGPQILAELAGCRGAARWLADRARPAAAPSRRTGPRPPRWRVRSVAPARPGQPAQAAAGRRCCSRSCGTAIVAVMAWALLGPRLLVVRSVQVVGAGRAVPAAQVLAAAHVRHGGAAHPGGHRRHRSPGRAAQAGSGRRGQQGLASHRGDHRAAADPGLRGARAWRVRRGGPVRGEHQRRR